MVLMRTPGAEAEAGGNVRALHQCNERGMGLGAAGSGRSRARKGKAGQQKKQPQRGLGVAQLEKLRMQEQNKQEAALFQSSPPAMFEFSGHDGACFRHGKAAIPPPPPPPPPPPHHHHSYGSEGHRKAGVDEDVFRTLMSLASTEHFSRARHAGASVVMLPCRKDDTERFFVCHTETLGNKVHGVNNPGAEASPARRASYALACDASPPSSVQKSPFFSSALVDSGVEVVRDEKPEAAVDTSLFSSKEVGVVEGKLRPLVSAGAPIFTFTNLQCFKSSLGPANLGRLSPDHVVGVRANCDRPKELSSFQSFLSNQPWSTPEKSCGWKRPWHALNESTCKLMHSESLDLNILAGDVDAPNRVLGSARLAHDQHVADGAHHSHSNVRSASEDGSLRSLKTRMCGMWDENQSADGVAVRDMGSEESHLKGRCEPESKRQNRCSSDFPPSSLTLNRRRCLSSPEIPLLTGSDHRKSGDFLTLGLSSFPVSPLVEVDDREATKQADIHAKEVHDILQLQMCNSQQQLRSHCLATNEGFCSEGSGAHVRPSFRFFPLPSGSVAEHCHKLTGTKEDFLDLRLKLAL